ncbi:protein-arginine deiminase family protein [Pyxidicoccus sp. MSG2]|uniref:protein-arginine deiminase family protein n=1 Tax=Pyxidicoccus sp. MSG2 TaxID=2996790 RepID=UPI00226F8FA7|nr:protein-arginine deiminase family protein [Pyxidicoccus sp. MSG2]MCY1019879.1 protein-arginine deiminase family protein [Pyxidicoccus sp. MSG2]
MWATPRVRARHLTFLLLPLLLAGGCEPVQQPEGFPLPRPERLTGPFTPIVDLRADVNRDGVVDLTDPTDDEGEDSWTAERGAIFLANIDDDEGACPFSLSPRTLGDDQLPGCNDAWDSVVNGEEDLEDLARLRVAPWPDAPDYAVGYVTVLGPAAKRVRLFERSGDTYTSQLNPSQISLTAAQLRRGVRLAIEANDIVRDPSKWDGFADVQLTIGQGRIPDTRFQDTVRMRVAPVVMFHHLTPAESVFVSSLEGNVDAAARFRKDLRATLTGFERPVTLVELQVEDLWTQDFLEPAYMSMPAPGGMQHSIQVNYRAPFVIAPEKNAALRLAGRMAFGLRGYDQAAVQQYQPGMSEESQTLNSFGNTEVIPPYEKDGVKYPLGRLFRGRGPDTRPDLQPDPSFTRLLEAQRVQPPVYVDTTWLNVSHVDETFSFLPANTPRGWVVLMADPALARRMLLDLRARGHGDAKLFTGLTWGFDRPAELTVSEVLDHAGFMDASALATLEIDTQRSILQEETGLTDAEIIRVPFLFQEVTGGLGALQPAMLNLLAVSSTQVIAPEPHGPLIDGKDPFKTYFEEALAAYGIRVHWSDVWSPYHINGGQVHCATNSARAIPATKWWEGGR